MGLNQKKERNAVYLSIRHDRHSICETYNEPRDGFTAIEVLNPKTKTNVIKYICEYDSVSGYVTKIDKYDRQDEKSGTRFRGYKLNIDADGREAILDLPFKSREYDAFTNFAENIDWRKPVEFVAFKGKNSRGDATTVFIAKQDGEIIRRKYTKDNPGKCPPAVFDQDEKEWDFSAQRKYLKEQLESVVIPAVQVAQAEREAGAARFLNSQSDPQANHRHSAPDDPFDDIPLDSAGPDADEIPFN